MFYKSCIQSVLRFSFICWFGNVSQKDKNKLQRIVNISSKITGLKQTSVTALYEKQVLGKANKIINDSTPGASIWFLNWGGRGTNLHIHICMYFLRTYI